MCTNRGSLWYGQTETQRTLIAGPRSRDESLLAAAEVTHRAKGLAEAREFELAAQWGEAHPGDEAPAMADSPVYEANVLFGDRPLEVAGYGAPTVSEFAITEFATAVGMSVDRWAQVPRRRPGDQAPPPETVGAGDGR